MIHCMTLWSYKQFKMFSAMTFTFFRVIRFRIAFCFDLQKSRSSKVRTECLRVCKKEQQEQQEQQEPHAQQEQQEQQEQRQRKRPRQRQRKRE